MGCCLVCRHCSEALTADANRALAYQEERSTQRAERIAELEGALELAAKLSRNLKAELDGLGHGPFVPLHQHENACKQRDEAFDRARAAEAEVERLRAALRGIKKHANSMRLGDTYKLAESALNPKTG